MNHSEAEKHWDTIRSIPDLTAIKYFYHLRVGTPLMDKNDFAKICKPRLVSLDNTDYWSLSWETIFDHLNKDLKKPHILKMFEEWTRIVYFCTTCYRVAKNLDIKSGSAVDRGKWVYFDDGFFCAAYSVLEDGMSQWHLAKIDKTSLRSPIAIIGGIDATDGLREKINRTVKLTSFA